MLGRVHLDIYVTCAAHGLAVLEAYVFRLVIFNGVLTRFSLVGTCIVVQ